MSKKEIEWSDKYYKKMLIEQRKRMWHDDTIEKLANWFGLKQGMKVADIGCGLGYLGFTYWEHFGKKGHYVGIDLSENLVKEATEMAKDWAKDGKAEFHQGSAYELKLKDNSFDVVMCQTLLMHLEFPEKALQEMKRILKPGGRIICIEPDNLANSTRPHVNTLYEESIDDMLLRFKVFYYGFKGHQKLQYGDNSIGSKLPLLLAKAGFTDLDGRCNDKINFIAPPYPENFLENARKTKDKKPGKEDKMWRKILRRDVLAGGGTEYMLRKYFKMVEKQRNTALGVYLDLIEANEYYTFNVNNLFVAIGRK